MAARSQTWTIRRRARLDGGWLETALADVLLKVTHQHGLEQTLLEVDSGRASAAVLIRPVSVTEIERTTVAKASDATQVNILHTQAQDRIRHPFTQRMTAMAMYGRTESVFGEDLAQLLLPALAMTGCSR